MTTLLLSSRHSDDDQALWRAAVRRGWPVERVRGFRIPEINDEEIVLYLEALLAPSIAKALGLQLIEPSEDWLVRLPEEYRKREIRLTSLVEARAIDEPVFLKPPNDKSFEAKVYKPGELPLEFDDSIHVLVAEPVKWLNEYRCFMLNGRVKTASPYVLEDEHAKLRDYSAPADELADAQQFAEHVVSDSRINVPDAVVVDVGFIKGQGWAVVEANGAWGSGIYGCDPDIVLDVIRYAVRRMG